MNIIRNYGVMYILLVIGQMFICNYVHLSLYVTLTLLPALVLCIPMSVSLPLVMLTAFVSGLAVDVLSDAVLGLNALALVPVAFMRRFIFRSALGDEAVDRGETISMRRNGVGKISIAIIMAQAVFLTIYILADGAGTRPFWFNLSRFFASMAASYLLSLLVVKMVSPDN